MLAFDYPLLGVMWTILFVALWLVFLFTLVHVMGDIFRRPDMSGVGKAVWLLWVIAFPFVGVLAYVLIHGEVMSSGTMQARSANEDVARGFMHLR